MLQKETTKRDWWHFWMIKTTIRWFVLCFLLYFYSCATLLLHESYSNICKTFLSVCLIVCWFVYIFHSPPTHPSNCFVIWCCSCHRTDQKRKRFALTVSIFEAHDTHTRTHKQWEQIKNKMDETNIINWKKKKKAKSAVLNAKFPLRKHRPNMDAVFSVIRP